MYFQLFFCRISFQFVSICGRAIFIVIFHVVQIKKKKLDYGCFTVLSIYYNNMLERDQRLFLRAISYNLDIMLPSPSYLLIKKKQNKNIIPYILR